MGSPVGPLGACLAGAAEAMNWLVRGRMSETAKVLRTPGGLYPHSDQREGLLCSLFPHSHRKNGVPCRTLRAGTTYRLSGASGVARPTGSWCSHQPELVTYRSASAAGNVTCIGWWRWLSSARCPSDWRHGTLTETGCATTPTTWPTAPEARTAQTRCATAPRRGNPSRTARKGIRMTRPTRSLAETGRVEGAVHASALEVLLEGPAARTDCPTGCRSTSAKGAGVRSAAPRSVRTGRNTGRGNARPASGYGRTG